MNKNRGIQYFFPVLAPLLLAGADFFVRSISDNALLNIEDIFRGCGIAIIFGCFTIDIWGITSSISRDNNVTMIFVFLLTLHLFLYGVGAYLDNHIVIMIKTAGIINQAPYWILLIVIVFSLGALIAGREYCWQKIEL